MIHFFPPGSDHYAVYQLRDGDETRAYRFESLEYLQQAGLAVKKENYDLVYSGLLTLQGSNDEVLESLFEKFNRDRPADFKGHSMSVSDVVVLSRNGVTTSHYCDRCGFEELPDFAAQERRRSKKKERTPRKPRRER